MRLAAAAVIAASSWALVGCGGSGATANAVSVPKAVGLDLVSATKTVKAAGLCWEIDFGNRGGTAIVRQKPQPGARVSPRTPVRLYLGLDFTTKPPEALTQAPGCPKILLTIVR